MAGFVTALLAVLLFGAVSVLGIIISVLLLFFVVCRFYMFQNNGLR